MVKAAAGALTLGGIGAWFGSSMGIAAFGTAVCGLLPIAAIGVVVGSFGGALWHYKTKR